MFKARPLHHMYNQRTIRSVQLHNDELGNCKVYIITPSTEFEEHQGDFTTCICHAVNSFYILSVIKASFTA